MKTITEFELARVTGGTQSSADPKQESAAERHKRFIDRIQSQPMPSESFPGLGF
jgi:bacteriocin-like protein